MLSKIKYKCVKQNKIKGKNHGKKGRCTLLTDKCSQEKITSMRVKYSYKIVETKIDRIRGNCRILGNLNKQLQNTKSEREVNNKDVKNFSSNTSIDFV